MKKSTLITIIIIVIVVAAGIYVLARNKNSSSYGGQSSTSNGSNNYGQTQSGQNSPAPSGAGTASTLTLNTSSSQALGAYLVAANGMTVYKFAQDKPGVSNCIGQCATLWPPYTVSSAKNLNLGSMLTGKISTISRADGSLQVTYNNIPLYFWHNDQKPGDTSGNGVGGVWFVVKP